LRSIKQDEKETHRVNIVYVLEPTIVIVTILAIGTNMSISAVKVSAFATIWTTSITSTLLEYQLLARTQALTMVVVAVLAGFTLAVEMVVIANFLVFYAFGEAYGGCWVGSWEGRVKTFVVSVEDDKLAVCCFLACDVDGLGRAFTYGCP
jgi:hypothetical protein